MRTLLLLCVLGWATTGCTGEITDGSAGNLGGDQGPDASTSMPGPDASPGAFTCRDKITANIGNGHHNPNQDCQQGCHDHGFTLSGTISTTTAGGTPVVGASITVKDSAGVTFDVVSQANGNFYTSHAVTFPVTVIASSCPDVQPMSATIAAGNGGCNKSGCHTAGTGTGAIHLP